MGTQIEVTDLTKSFGKQLIWGDVTLTIPAGEVSVMLGPSGTGKSVFLKALIGLLKPDRGSIMIEGTDIATPLKQTGAFPALVGYMVSVGEQSGELEQMLDRVAIAYDEEIDIATERMTAVIEPIMIIFLAVVLGYIVVSIVLPILQIGQVK